jgi:hypothetical protein
VTLAHGNVWTRTHQMTLGGKDDGFTRDDLLRVGAMMDVPRVGDRSGRGRSSGPLDPGDRRAVSALRLTRLGAKAGPERPSR